MFLQYLNISVVHKISTFNSSEVQLGANEKDKHKNNEDVPPDCFVPTRFDWIEWIHH